MRRLLPALLVLVPALVVAGFAAASSGVHKQLREVERATSQYRDVAQATSAGYGEFRDKDGIACIALPGVGGMGVHYVNGGLVGDTVLDPLRPESLVYAVGGGGRLKLAAVEYIVFAEAWDAEHADPPSLFGATFDFTPAGNRYGIPAFYALHAWIYRGNPTGTFSPWNPRVTCD
jgi:hypothetical protein